MFDVLPLWDTTIKHIESLSLNHTYELREELRDGTIIEHDDIFTHDVLKSYIERIWIDSHPPTLIICPHFKWEDKHNDDLIVEEDDVAF